MTAVAAGGGSFFGVLQGGAATGPTMLVVQGGAAGFTPRCAVSGEGPSDGKTPGEPTVGPIRMVSPGGLRSAPTT